MKKRRALYEIRNDIKQIFDEGVDKETGEITDDAISNLDALDIEVKEKIHACGQQLRKLKDEVTNASQEIKDIQAIKRSLDYDVERLQSYMILHMTELGITEVIMDGRKVKLAVGPKTVDVVDWDLFARDDTWIKESVEYKAMKRDIMIHFKETGQMPKGVVIKEGKPYIKV